MIGNLVPRGIKLDYTAVARPLAVDDVMRDVEECAAQHFDYPDEIVMWEHQWDWMTKHVDNRGGYQCGAPDSRVGYKSIIGIRVRIENA